MKWDIVWEAGKTRTSGTTEIPNNGGVIGGVVGALIVVIAVVVFIIIYKKKMQGKHNQ